MADNPLVLRDAQLSGFGTTALAMQEMMANHLHALHSLDTFASELTTFLQKEVRPPAIQSLLEASAQHMLMLYAEELDRLVRERNADIHRQATQPERPRVIAIPPRYILSDRGKEQQAYKRQLVAEYEQAGWLERLSSRFANAPRWKQELEEDDRLDREHEERYRKMYGGD